MYVLQTYIRAKNRLQKRPLGAWYRVYMEIGADLLYVLQTYPR
jgi:hypothetical protein